MYEPNEALKHFTLMIVDRYFSLLNGTRSLLDYCDPFSYTLLATSDPTSVPPGNHVTLLKILRSLFFFLPPHPTLAISNE